VNDPHTPPVGRRGNYTRQAQANITEERGKITETGQVNVLL